MPFVQTMIEAIQDEPAQPEAREPSLHPKKCMERQIEASRPVQPTHICSTIPEEIEPADLVTPDGLTPHLATTDHTTPDLATPDLATPDLATPDQSIWATFRRYLFGVSMRKGGKGKNHIDHHRPEPKEEEEKPTDEFSSEMAAKRNKKKPKCKYGVHRSLDQPGDDVENKMCKFHKSRKGKDKQWLECE